MQDPKKFSRATELLRLNEEIKEAKKVRGAVLQCQAVSLHVSALRRGWSE